MFRHFLALVLVTVMVVSVGNFAAADMPEKPDKLNIIALDIDVIQFGEAAQEFEDNYGIEVEWLEYPYGELWNQITTSIAGGATIDLFHMSNSWHAELAELGMVRPLNDFYTDEELEGINEMYWDVTVEFMKSHGGQQWAFPGTAASVSFFYNEGMLEELGYTEPPETWDEMLQISREAMDEGLASYGFFPGWLAAHEDGMVWFDIMLKLHGGEWMTEDRSEFIFNSEAGVEAVTLMKEILDEGLVPRAALEESDWANYHYFLAGDQPFEINWNFIYGSALDPDRSEIVDDIAVALMPGIEKDSYTVLGGGGYAVSPTSRAPEWAALLSQYMHSEEGARGVMAEQRGAEGTVEKLYHPEYDDDFPAEEYPLRDFFYEQMQYAGLRPSHFITWYSEFRDNIFTPAVHRALLGQQDVEEALNQAQQEAQRMLEAEGL